MSEADLIPFAPQALRRDAHAWVARLTVGEPTVEDARGLAVWRATSTAHEEAYLEAAALWRALQPAADALRADPPARRDMDLRSVDRRALVGGALAASLGALMLARPPYGLWPSLGELVADAEADYRTAPGEQRAVRLSPQVVATLNTRTRLARDRAQPHARAVLLAGEGLFAVGAAPFTVQAAGARCAARNASFDVRLEGAGASIACLGGDVLVQRGGDSVRLPAGERVAFLGAGLGRPAPADLGEATAWRRGELIFRDAPLGTVIAELNRYRPGRLLLANPVLSHRQVNGVFRIDRLDDILAQLEQGYGARLSRFPGGVVVVT